MSMSGLRMVVFLCAGVASAAIGLLALVTSVGVAYYTVFGMVLGCAGAVLAWLGLADLRPGPIVWAAVAVLAVIGLLASLLVVREDICCMFGYHRGLGYPWGWLDSGADAATLDEIEEIAAAPERLPLHLDPFKLLLDALFWTQAAVLAVIPAVLVLRGARPDRPGDHEVVPPTRRRAVP
ncbi:hypothetical protein AB0B31_08555 [Catellatospora citrea]|uniref:hypothetical protein n=1 Tax=Catellatospora citrea TaxID=53366 RepID=UPI0033CACD65